MSKPPTRTYRYTVAGTDRDNKEWVVTGLVDILPGDFFKIPEIAGAEVFMKLTNGMAVFGHPEETCKGPYRFRNFTITEEQQFNS